MALYVGDAGALDETAQGGGGGGGNCSHGQRRGPRESTAGVLCGGNAGLGSGAGLYKKGYFF